MKKAKTKQTNDDDYGEEEDEYEDYFARQMDKDMEIVQENSEPVDYASVLHNIQSKIKDINQISSYDEEDKYEMEEEAYYLQGVGEDQDQQEQ